MKQKFKFIAMVFGVTLAITSSLKVNAIGAANDGVHCESGSDKGCARVQLANGGTGWLVGIRVEN